MKHNRKLEKAFGLNEFGMVYFPKEQLNNKCQL